MTTLKFFIVALVFWLGWHALQFRIESKEYHEDAEKVGNPDGMRKALDRNGD